MSGAPRALFGAVLGLGLLAGCSNHDSAGVQEGGSVGGTMVKSAFGKILPGKFYKEDILFLSMVGAVCVCSDEIHGGIDKERIDLAGLVYHTDLFVKH
jgi:hypothetical protein